MIRWRAGLRALAFAPAAALSMGVTCASPPDLDATPGGATLLPLDGWQRDALDCTRRGGDCADWFHFEAPVAGSFQIDLATLEQGEEIPALSVGVGDARGAVAVEKASDGSRRVALQYPQGGGYVEAGRHSLVVQTPEEGDAAFGYDLRVSFTPKPPPPKPALPRFDTVRAVLLEVEARGDGSEAVLIDKGSRAGIARGQKGRLLERGRKVADIEILEVYPDGSRALIRGAPGAALTPATVAEVDVPR